MNRKLFFLVAAIFWSAISYQNTSVAQTKSESLKVESQTPQPDKLPPVGKCPKLPNHEKIIFTGQVKRILPYKKRKPSQTHFRYREPQEDFEPKETIRFAVNKIYQGLGEGYGEVKELLADVFVDAAHPAPIFKIGENYLVYATPRYCGKNSFSLEDNLILYSDAPTQLVSHAQDKIRSLGNPLQKSTPNDMFGVAPQKFIFKSGILRSRATRIVQPKYPDGVKRIGGTVQVQVLVNENGNVIAAKTICAPDELFAPPAKEAALKSTYTPMKASDKPIKMSTIIVYNFIAQ